ncbi:transporter [Pedobacter sp. HMF7647]|uniref:Transporter n=1 Tax=Hufsiella arboris TaxID=2695275 RepID=A0A7K1Y6K9_9SPHI|nr:transporter [Hufsiella arboris]MXV50207.1 transporter [Hufsiella arboris]
MKYFLVITLSIFGLGANCQENTHYTLFNPVPKQLMGDMETDRPDVTESAYSVPAGHFQVESDLFKSTTNKDGDLKSVENDFNKMNVKLGLTKSVDIQLVVSPFNDYKVKSTTSGQVYESSSGFGDMTFRVKKNLWGNDGGKTALSMMPYVNFPTSKTSEGVDGGIVFPFALKLPDDWSFGAQTQFDLVRNEMNKNYHAEILNSFTFGKEFSKSFSSFVESFYTYDFLNNKADLYVDGGIIYSFSDNFNIDAGLNYGITKASDKVYFVGCSFRY